jgi:osmotically-inducible protein OsmY
MLMFRLELEAEVVRVPSRGAIAALAAYSVVACSTAPPRSPAERAADAAAAARVEVALDDDPRIYARHIDVRVDRGVVHLGGFVWSAEDFLFAKNDAAAVPGISTVVNEMELMRGGMTGTSR